MTDTLKIRRIASDPPPWRAIALLSLLVGMLAAFLTVRVMRLGDDDARVTDTHGQTGLVWSLNADPTAGAGIAAPMWQFLIRTDAPSLYYKSGAASTAWTKVGAGASGALPNLGGDDTQDLSASANFPILAAPSATAAGIRLTGYAGHVSFICGIDATGAADGRIVFVWADGPANTLGLLPDTNANCAATTAANRFWQFNSAALTDVGGAMYRYSTTKSRWVLATYPQ